MNFELSAEQRAFQETARAFAGERWAPHAALWDRESIFPEDALREAAALGFAAITVDQSYGGSGLGRLEATLITEELAAACASRPPISRSTTWRPGWSMPSGRPNNGARGYPISVP